MIKIVWTETAINDLDHIYQYIALDSEVYARALVDELFSSVDRLELFPKSGRIVPEIGKPQVREILIGNYRLIYDIKNSSIQILTVVHGARKLGR